MSRPRLFLSAVSTELRTVRQAVAVTVRTLGFDPVSQDDFPTGYGELHQWLREQIDSCEGLIQLVGHAYGAEPPEVDPEYGRVSYTQFEFLYACHQGKKTWIIVVGEHCSHDKPPDQLDLPRDSGQPDPAGYQADRLKLQHDYIARLTRENHLHHTADNDTELQNIVLRLRDELGELRQRSERRQRPSEGTKFFVSYAREDAQFVLKLAKDLRADWANLWVDQLDIPPGVHWDTAVEEALETCGGMLLILSPDAVASNNVKDEVAYALDKGKRIVPVVLRECQIPLRLRRLQYIGIAAQGEETGIAQVRVALTKREGQAGRAHEEQAVLDRERRAQVETEEKIDRRREATREQKPGARIEPEHRQAISTRRAWLRLVPLLLAGLALLAVLIAQQPEQDLLKNAPQIISTAAQSPLGILALMVLMVGVLAYLLFGRGDASQTVRAVIFLSILGSVTVFGVAVARQLPHGDSIYRVRATLLGPSDVPLDGARVWSTVGGEAKQVPGGWQLDIPGGSVAAGGRVTIYAEKASAFLSGTQDLTLGSDLNPTVTVTMERKLAALRGRVQGADGRAVQGATVTVPGGRSVITTADGNFVLDSVAANGQQVRVDADASGYQHASQEHPAGDTPLVIVLDRE